jgi:hypothetical protein
MAAPLQPSIRFTLLLRKVPAALGVNTYRWATRPFADAGAWAEGRLSTWGSIERSLSTPDGDYDIASCQVELDDSDGLFRGLLADPTTRIFTGREAAIEILSEAGRAAGTAWRTLFRGHVSGVQTPPGRKAVIKISDCVGSSFSGFDLEKKMGVAITRQEHPNAPDKVIGRIYPIVIGEHSDVGAVDANGDAADKGLLPVIDVGDYLIDADGELVADTPLSYLTSPTNGSATVNGTPGTTSYTYKVTALSGYGETLGSTITVATGAATLTSTDSIALTWDAVTGAIEYRVYRQSGSGGTGLVQRLNNGESYADPETTWTDTGASATGQSAPATNTAIAEQILADGTTAFGWGRLITKIGANAEVHHVYASNLATGEAPKRERMDESVYGSEFLVYGRAGWPHADPYIEINGIRMGVIYARGPRLKHHRDGVVTIAWNGCGDDDIGDGSGDTIDEAFLALQHVLNEYVLKDGGVGYRTGVFGPLETWANGVAKLKTSAFAAMQALTVTWVGSAGYMAAFAITEPISVRDFLRKFAVTFACHYGSNHHGQVFPVLLDDTATVTAGRIYRDRIEIARLEGQEIDHDAVETRIRYHYDFDTDGQRFRVADQIIEDEAMSDAYGAPRERATRQCYYTRHDATAVDSCSRHLTRYKVAPRYITFRTDLTGLEDELGAQIRLTHYDGAGGTSGDSATPCLVYTHRTHAQAPSSVSLTGFDLLRILSTGFPLLGDKTSISGNLYDKTNPNEPTAGAYELR